MANVREQVSQAVETAKEAAQNVGEQVSDFFQGNPFATPVGKKIELATDSNLLATENWGLNMEICDFINGYEEGPKDAIRAIRKRLHTQVARNNANVMYTLTVLETCVKNCGHRFHIQACAKDFVMDLVKLIGPRFDAPQIIQERVLGLIQAWSDAFRNAPDLQGVCQVYDDLKSKGVEFPAANIDTLAPILTPKRTIPQQPKSAAVTMQPQPLGQPQQTYQVAPRSEEPVQANGEQLVKLRKDLNIVNSNLKVFRELLTEIVPVSATQDELQLIMELNQVSRQMQQRILELIGQVSNSEVTHELLVINDEFHNVFEKFERFMANKDAEPPKNTGVKASDLLNLEPVTSTSEQLSALSVSAASASSAKDVYAANAEPQSNSSLAAAVNNRTTAVSPQEAAEMEEWLSRQDTKELHNPENDKL